MFQALVTVASCGAEAALWVFLHPVMCSSWRMCLGLKPQCSDCEPSVQRALLCLVLPTPFPLSPLCAPGEGHEVQLLCCDDSSKTCPDFGRSALSTQEKQGHVCCSCASQAELRLRNMCEQGWKINSAVRKCQTNFHSL